MTLFLNDLTFIAATFRKISKGRSSSDQTHFQIKKYSIGPPSMLHRITMRLIKYASTFCSLPVLVAQQGTPNPARQVSIPLRKIIFRCRHCKAASPCVQTVPPVLHSSPQDSSSPKNPAFKASESPNHHSSHRIGHRATSLRQRNVVTSVG